jgi:hypothetical protein
MFSDARQVVDHIVCEQRPNGNDQAKKANSIGDKKLPAN